MDVPEGDLRRQRYEAMKVAQHRDMSKHKLDELPWSTGLLDVWRDPEILSMSLTGASLRGVWGAEPLAAGLRERPPSPADRQSW